MRRASERATQALGLTVVGAAAVLVGKLSATRPPAAAALLLAPAVLVSIISPSIPLVASVALLPFQSEPFSVNAGGFLVGPSDALLLLGVFGVAAAVLSGADLGMAKLRPLVPFLTIYFLALTVAWLHLPSTDGVASSTRFSAALV